MKIWLLLLAAQESAILDFGPGFDLKAVVAWDATAELAPPALRVRSGHAQDWPGLTFKGAWDLSRHERVLMDVVNTGASALEVGLRIDSGESDGLLNACTGRLALAPGARGTLVVEIERRTPAPEGAKLFGMRGFPGSRYQTIDPARVNQLIVFVPKPTEDHRFEIARIRAAGTFDGPAPRVPEKFFPFIDELGQYIHRDWPGKARDADDLRRRAEAEAVPEGPKGWNAWGGWAAGPQLEATGHFRAQKHGGRWWLVDPEGRLFWSHGVNGVDFGNSTPVEERETWFRGLPARDDPVWREFFHPAREVLHDHYRGRRPLCFRVGAANLYRKFGPDWKATSTELAHRRLRGWGLNTIANWSDESIYLGRKTPYVVAIHFGGRALEGSEGYWQPFRDVFAPEFRDALRDRLKWEATRSALDPACIGYFVDNELSWGDELSLAVATLRSPAAQPAKREFLADLRRTHATIEALNAAWGASHGSWDALLAHRAPPDVGRARADLLAFSRKTVERYFALSRELLREAAPKKLYLGCRFAWQNALAVEVAARHADVLSFNVYQRPPESFTFPAADVPILITEFHFGALDRGPFHPGLVKARDQAERARFYRAFAAAARRHPQVVGTHWFQYRDQPTTGRELDGENYQIGFVDVADTPYPELAAAAREVGDALYR